MPRSLVCFAKAGNYFTRAEPGVPFFRDFSDLRRKVPPGLYWRAYHNLRCFRIKNMRALLKTNIADFVPKGN
jgi:hypothetical protein